MDIIFWVFLILYGLLCYSRFHYWLGEAKGQKYTRKDRILNNIATPGIAVAFMVFMILITFYDTLLEMVYLWQKNRKNKDE